MFRLFVPFQQLRQLSLYLLRYVAPHRASACSPLSAVPALPRSRRRASPCPFLSRTMKQASFISSIVQGGGMGGMGGMDY